MKESAIGELLSDSSLVKFLAVVLVTAAVSLVSRFVLRSMVRKRSAARHPWDREVASALAAPFTVLVWVVGLEFAVEVSRFVESPAAVDWASRCRDVGVVVTLAWFLSRLITRIQNVIGSDQASVQVDSAVLYGMGKLLRLVVLISAGLIIMQTLGFSIAGVLTFGGIGGIAVGFAAKDMLANFFGGLMIYLDRPFKAGDWVRSPEREIEGIVEDIGWRVTRIRNFDSRPLYVPNSSFSTISIENVSRMTNRRIYETFGVRYEDSTAVDAIVEQITGYLQGHDEIDQQQTLMVSFTTCGPSSLDLFIYCYTRTQSGPVYYRIKQEVLLNILQIIERNGAECAFPTTTVHVAGNAPVSPSAEDGSP